MAALADHRIYAVREVDKVRAMILGRLRLMGGVLACAILPGVSALTASGASAQQAAAPPTPLKCEIGPTAMRLGGNDWFVYACDDRASMAVASRADGTESSVSFYLRPRPGAWEVQVVGDGEDQAHAAARADLSSYSATNLEWILSDILEADFEAKFGWPPTSEFRPSSLQAR
jgi:hypothetical protein